MGIWCRDEKKFAGTRQSCGPRPSISNRFEELDERNRVKPCTLNPEPSMSNRFEELEKKNQAKNGGEAGGGESGEGAGAGSEHGEVGASDK